MLCCCYRPFSHCIGQAGLGAFTAKSGRKHYNPPPLTIMWMNFDSPNYPSLCSLSAIISFQTCSNKCILYVLSFHKCIKIKYKMVSAKFFPLKYYTLSSQLQRLTSFSVGCSGRRILSPGQIAVMRKWSIVSSMYYFTPWAITATCNRIKGSESDYARQIQ